jgi:hypothetical protein
MTALTYVANRLSHRYGFGCPPDTDKDVLLSDPFCTRWGWMPKRWTRIDQEALAISVTAQHLVS